MKKIIIALVLVLVIAAAVVGFNLHTCEGCGEMYFGKGHATETWGDICDDCYMLYGGMEDVFGADSLKGFFD